MQEEERSEDERKHYLQHVGAEPVGDVYRGAWVRDVVLADGDGRGGCDDYGRHTGEHYRVPLRDNGEDGGQETTHDDMSEHEGSDLLWRDTKDRNAMSERTWLWFLMVLLAIFGLAWLLSGCGVSGTITLNPDGSTKVNATLPAPTSSK